MWTDKADKTVERINIGTENADVLVGVSGKANYEVTYLKQTFTPSNSALASCGGDELLYSASGSQ